MFASFFALMFVQLGAALDCGPGFWLLPPADSAQDSTWSAFQTLHATTGWFGTPTGKKPLASDENRLCIGEEHWSNEELTKLATGSEPQTWKKADCRGDNSSPREHQQEASVPDEKKARSCAVDHLPVYTVSVPAGEKRGGEKSPWRVEVVAGNPAAWFDNKQGKLVDVGGYGFVVCFFLGPSSSIFTPLPRRASYS